MHRIYIVTGKFVAMVYPFMRRFSCNTCLEILEIKKQKDMCSRLPTLPKNTSDAIQCINTAYDLSEKRFNNIYMKALDTKLNMSKTL